MATQVITIGSIRNAVSHYLVDKLGVTSFSVGSAKLSGSQWMVNVEYIPKGGSPNFTESALFVLDAMSGVVKEFKKGYIYRW